ncbi:hypothetical protein PFAG_04636 [Plasmodium falciparum Santa Lucia]|nr:hypothetical protein PFFVO_00359 [Plasmodium falciparum Vietnam Oak-Knoll (FVO)]ETW45467.1 hypothetical protein PFNF135_00388 [Plasmodium falciparum NF135/5.C10]EUT79996.1 hypothetical protein PFAG_04636 [Plasmodium falciparum Santa Lucia]
MFFEEDKSIFNVFEVNIFPCSKYCVIILRNVCEIENENKEIRKNIMIHLDKTNESSTNSNNNKQIILENKPYNDFSKKLTEHELREALNSLEECSP